MNADGFARFIAKKIEEEAFDRWTFNKEEGQYMGDFDLDVATAIIKEALSTLSIAWEPRENFWERAEAVGIVRKQESVIKCNSCAGGPSIMGCSFCYPPDYPYYKQKEDKK